MTEKEMGKSEIQTKKMLELVLTILQIRKQEIILDGVSIILHSACLINEKKNCFGN